MAADESAASCLTLQAEFSANNLALVRFARRPGSGCGAGQPLRLPVPNGELTLLEYFAMRPAAPEPAGGSQGGLPGALPACVGHEVPVRGAP